MSQINALNIEPLVQSRWLNAVSAYLSPTQIDQLKQLPFVVGIRKIKSIHIASNQDSTNQNNDYTQRELDYSLSYMRLNTFATLQLTAKNIKIGVADVGFKNLDTDQYTAHLVKNNQIIEKKDFVNKNTPDSNFYKLDETNSDFHGQRVMQGIGGIAIDPTDNHKTQFGLATNALYYLARTDHGDKETRQDEDNWVAALEWFETKGIRLVNSSLGYKIGRAHV